MCCFCCFSLVLFAVALCVFASTKDKALGSRLMPACGKQMSSATFNIVVCGGENLKVSYCKALDKPSGALRSVFTH